MDITAEWSDIGWNSNEVTVSPMNIGTKLTTIMHHIIIIISIYRMPQFVIFGLTKTWEL